MWRRWLVVAALLLGGAAAGEAGEPAAPEPYRIRVPHTAGTAVRRAVLSVGRRLDDEECREVFNDFNATTLGRPLSEVLDEWGRSPADHLAALVFKDGSGKPACANPGVLAYTRVGSDTVYICATQFTRAVAADPSFAEIVLIHELLHTVGLGENPPTSREITARVLKRCGDWRARRPPTHTAAAR
jgi:hypothetical protein